MIAAETPIVLARAAELLVTELTLQSWVNTCKSKRRTLQKSDISAVVSKSELFDFLIDIVPREEKPQKNKVPVLQQQPQPLQQIIPQQQQQQQVQPMFVGGNMNQLMYQLGGGQNLSGSCAVVVQNAISRNTAYSFSPQVFQVPSGTSTPNQSATNSPVLQLSNSTAVISGTTLSSKSTVTNTVYQSVMYNNNQRLPISLSPSQFNSLIPTNNTTAVMGNQPIMINPSTTQYISQTTHQQMIIPAINSNLAASMNVNPSKKEPNCNEIK